MTDETSHDQLSRARQSACDALAKAERAGLPLAELERLADRVIVSRPLVESRGES